MDNADCWKKDPYNMKAVTKEWGIAEKFFRLLWDSNLLCLDKNPML